jgi:hypothetical protein
MFYGAGASKAASGHLDDPKRSLRIECQDIDAMPRFIELPGNSCIHFRQVVPFMVFEEARVVYEPIAHVCFKPVAGTPSSASVNSHVRPPPFPEQTPIKDIVVSPTGEGYWIRLVRQPSVAFTAVGMLPAD